MIRKERGKQRSPTNPVVLHTRKKQLRDHADVNTLPLVGPLRDPMACCSSDALSRRTTSARADLSSWISSSCIWTLCSREAMRSVTSILLAADALSSEDTHVRDEENVTKLKAESFLSHTITCKSGCVTDDRNCFIHSRMPIEHILWHAGRTVLKTSKARVGLKNQLFLQIAPLRYSVSKHSIISKKPCWALDFTINCFYLKRLFMPSHSRRWRQI